MQKVNPGKVADVVGARKGTGIVQEYIPDARVQQSDDRQYAGIVDVDA